MQRATSGFHPPTRDHLILAAFDFCEHVSRLAGVERVAVIGSICTPKPEPKDVDVLVTIAPAVDMAALANLGRRLRGKAQHINCGADIFVSNLEGRYIGRICRWRDCRPGIRVACEATHCGRVQYLYDDLQNVELDPHLISDPPLIIYPEIRMHDELPDDLLNEVRRRFGSPAAYP